VGFKNVVKTLDPRTILVLGLLGLSAVFCARSVETLVVEAVVVSVLLFFLEDRESVREMLRLTCPMVGVVALISLLSFDAAAAMYQTVRLFNLLVVSGLFFHVLGPDGLETALRKLNVPYSLVFLLTTSFRYVPLMKGKIRHIMDAQISRGIDLRPRLKNAPHFIALLMPLLIQSLILSDELAMAMMSRGYGSRQRTMRTCCRFMLRDYGVMAVSLTGFAVFFWWERTRL